MRILLVSEDIPARQLGGLGRHVVRLGNALLGRGHTVTLMGRADIPYDECASEVGFNGPYIGGFDWRRVGWKEVTLGVFLPFKRPHIAKRIARSILARSGEFDVVHYHGHFPLVGRYIPKTVNFVQTRHDQGSECIIHTRFRRGQVCHEADPRECAACATERPNLLQRVISSCAVRQYRRMTADALSRHPTIFVSNFLRQRFGQIVPGVNQQYHVVIHNFVDRLSWPASLTPTVGAARPKRIVVVGRIDEAKGVGAFLAALHRHSTIGIAVDIVGDGPLRKSLEETWELPTVSFSGWCLPEEVLQRIASADVMVVPSIWEEPCGTTILEGLSVGKPVFALALGGTPELKQYEQWDGQLALFSTMELLVDALLTAPAYRPVSFPKGDVDVEVVVNRTLAVYRTKSA